MEDLGLREDVLSPDTKTEPGDSSPESKRRRLMSDSSSSHTEEPETFGSPEPPIPMPVPDVKKEDESHGIVMPTAPKEEVGDGDAEKAGTSSGGKGEEAGLEGEGDKGAGLGDEPPRDEKTKEQLAEEERQRMQVLVASFSEEQLNRYEMYRRSSFPKAAIKRTVTSDENTGQQRVVSLGQQPIVTSSVLSQVGGIAAVPQPVQSQAGQGQPNVPPQPVGQQGNVLPGTSLAANSNAALQQALSALQPLLLQSGAQPTLGLPGAQPTIGLPGTQPTFGLPINQMFQTPPTVPLLPIQQLLPGLTSPYQPSPSTTVFVLPQPLATQAQPVAETQTAHVRHQHKNCCPGCVAEIQELRRLVDLIIRANANTIPPGLSGSNIGTNITPLLLQQHASPTIKSTSIPDNTIPTVQRIIQNPAIFTPSPSFSEQAQIPLIGQEMSKPPPLTSKAVQERTGLLPGCHTEWHEEDESFEPQEVEEKAVPTSSSLMRQEDVARASTSHHSLRYEPLWKSKRGKNTMEMIQSRLEPDPLNPSQYIVKEEVLAMLRQKSDDRQFIARRLANLLFTKQERKISNCHGRRHKRPLDPVRLDAIKRAVFRINPTTPENLELAWKQCCASIDMSSRSACRNIKQP